MKSRCQRRRTETGPAPQLTTDMGSVVSSLSGVRGGVLTENDFHSITAYEGRKRIHADRYFNEFHVVWA